MKQLPIGTKVFVAGVTGISWTVQKKSSGNHMITLRSAPNSKDHEIPAADLRHMIYEKSVTVEVPLRHKYNQAS